MSIFLKDLRQFLSLNSDYQKPSSQTLIGRKVRVSEKISVKADFACVPAGSMVDCKVVRGHRVRTDDTSSVSITQMLVYRVEHPKYKLGPYQCMSRHAYGECLVGMLKEHNKDFENHPIPFQTFGCRVVFGFKSTDQLKDWFSLKWRIFMHELGFIVKVYDLPSNLVYGDNRQCWFNKDKIKKLRPGLRRSTLTYQTFSLKDV